MSAIPVSPITATLLTVSKPNKITKLQTAIDSCAGRLNFLGELDCPTSVSWANRRSKQNSMGGSNGIRATTSDEGLHAFEQEALMEGPPKLGGGGGRGGIEATLNNLSKWLVAALFTAIILWKHDAEALWAAMGAVLNSALSVMLKKILNQERPTSTLRSDPGMPSSHAQSIFYTIIFVNLSMVEQFGMNALTAILSTLFFITGSYFSWLRVSQQLHTLSQVIVGAVIGSIFSGLWFWSWNNFVLYSFASTLWVRIVVITGAVGFSLGFLHHVYSTWILEER